MSRIDPLKIDEVRSAVNIVHYISQFVTLKKAGQNFKGLCPFHTEKTPSFIVSPAKQIFHCFGCGKGGNVFTFIMEYEKLTFVEALRRAADFAGIPLPEESLKRDAKERTYFDKLYEINETASRFFEEQLFHSANKAHLDYFKNRGLSERTIKKFRLGYAPDANNRLLEYLKKQGVDLVEAEKLGLLARSSFNTSSYYDKFRHRVMFPFLNLSGRIVGFGGRKLREEQQPKYLNSPESPIYKKGSVLYGLHQAISAIRENDYVIVVEGYFDLLRLVENGINNVVASSGTALTDSQARLINRYTQRVVLLYDGDDAGRKAALRNGYILETNGLNVSIAVLPQNEDPDSFVQNHGVKALMPYLETELTPLEFEIKTFTEAHPSARMDEKNVFVGHLLEQLAEMNNPLKTGLYLPLIADRLAINEAFLVEQFRKIEKRMRRARRPAVEEEATPTKEQPLRLRRGQFQAEASVVFLLISGPQEVRNYLMSQLSYDLFENDLFIQVYETVIAELEDTGTVERDRIVAQFQDDVEFQSALSEFELMEYDDPFKLARDCVFQLKRWRLEKQTEEIQTLIRSDAESTDAVVHYSMELTRIRKELNQLVKDYKEGR